MFFALFQFPFPLMRRYIYKTGQAEQIIQTETGITGQAEQDRHKTARTGLPGQGSQDKQDRTARK
jgi:hypothetical protein